MRWIPHLTVACIVEDKGKLLFVEEMSLGKVVLNQPAGHVDKHESLEQAAIRETLEETGCEVIITSILGIYQHHAKHNDTTYFRVCFNTELVNKYKGAQLDNDIIGTAWLEPDNALTQENRFRSPLVKTCIEDYLKKQSFPLDMLKELPSS